MASQRYSIGRALDSDVVLADPSISRRHAELELHDQAVTIIDCNSTHGTYVVENGRTTPVGRKVVHASTALRLGDLALTVSDLLDAIRLKYPGASTPARHAVSREIPQPRGSKLVRCSCGVIKPDGATCPGCGS